MASAGQFTGPLASPDQILECLEHALGLDDIRQPPSKHLERLAGDLDGYHSIRINDQYRVVFRWESGSAYEVLIVDYH